MIYDSSGTPLRRTIGFIGGYTPVRKERMVTDAIASDRIDPQEPSEDLDALVHEHEQSVFNALMDRHRF